MLISDCFDMLLDW